MKSKHYNNFLPTGEEVKGFDRMQLNNSSNEIIGICPKCGNDVVTTDKAYSCTGNGCKFIIWKSVCGAKLPSDQAKKLIQEKRTDLIKGMKSKSGSSFNAYLHIKADFTIGIEFAERTRATSSPLGKK